MFARDEEFTDVPAGWPERIIELALDWKQSEDPGARQKTHSELWLLVNAALAKYLRIHSLRYGPVNPEDLKDIASQKSLDLMRKLDSREWRPEDSSPPQLCSMISVLARNGLVDHIRVVDSKKRRSVEIGESEDYASAARPTRSPAAADVRIDRRRFTDALKDCVSQLGPRAQTMWMFRVLLDMPSKKIAKHPEIGMNPAAVDMTLARCRTKVTECMKAKGFDPHDMPPGTFVTLWEAFRYNLARQSLPEKGSPNE